MSKVQMKYFAMITLFASFVVAVSDATSQSPNPANKQQSSQANTKTVQPNRARPDFASMSDVERLALIEQNFRRLDKDGNRSISLEEAPVLITRKIQEGQAVREQRSSRVWIARMDRNNDNLVSWEEYRSRMDQVLRGQ